MELDGLSQAIIGCAVFAYLKREVACFALSLLRVLRGEKSHVPMRELASHSLAACLLETVKSISNFV